MKDAATAAQWNDSANRAAEQAEKMASSDDKASDHKADEKLGADVLESLKDA